MERCVVVAVPVCLCWELIKVGFWRLTFVLFGCMYPSNIMRSNIKELGSPGPRLLDLLFRQRAQDSYRFSARYRKQNSGSSPGPVMVSG